MTREEATEKLKFESVRQQLMWDNELNEAIKMAIEALSAEPLTDTEQRIFLSAMGREEKVCREVDAGHPRENYEDTLLSVCRSITRKVKGALWK